VGLPMTQEDFAKLLGISVKVLDDWENGRTIQTRTMDNMLRLFFANRRTPLNLPEIIQSHRKRQLPLLEGQNYVYIR